jgi:hypothetical protein
MMGCFKGESRSGPQQWGTADGMHACTAMEASAPNIISSRPMSHLEPSETKTSPALRPTCE